MNKDIPDWKRFDTLRSLRDVAKTHLTQLIFRPVERWERMYDIQLNGLTYDIDFEPQAPVATEEELDG